MTFARGALGASLATNPLDGVQQAVDLSAGLADFYRHEIAKAALLMEAEPEKATARISELAGPYTEAIKLAGDTSKAAVSLGIAERRQRLAERDAERIAAAIADGLREVFGELATNARRAAFAKVVSTRLLVLEGQAIETTARSLPRAG